MCATGLLGNGATWIDGEEPQVGDTIDIDAPKTYGARTNRNYTVGFDVQFEGSGSAGFRASIDTRSNPTCAPIDTDNGINARPGDPTRLDAQHVIYDNATISGNAVSRAVGLSAEEMKDVPPQA